MTLWFFYSSHYHTPFVGPVQDCNGIWKKRGILSVTVISRLLSVLRTGAYQVSEFKITIKGKFGNNKQVTVDELCCKRYLLEPVKGHLQNFVKSRLERSEKKSQMETVEQGYDVQIILKLTYSRKPLFYVKLYYPKSNDRNTKKN